MKVVYVLTDCDDRRNTHVFQQRHNAIKYAYEDCNAYGAYLSVPKEDVEIGEWKYQALSEVVGDGDVIDYLNSLSDEDVNDIFYEYYFLAEVAIEDIED